MEYVRLGNSGLKVSRICLGCMSFGYAQGGTHAWALGEERGLPMAQIALAWLMAKLGVTAPIPGTTQIKHLEDGLASLSVKLTEKEIKSLEEPYVPHAIAKFV